MILIFCDQSVCYIYNENYTTKTVNKVLQERLHVKNLQKIKKNLRMIVNNDERLEFFSKI